MWHIVGTPGDVPSDRDLRLAVIEAGNVHDLVFPCRRLGDSWIDAKTGRKVDIYPTHWQAWTQEAT